MKQGLLAGIAIVALGAAVVYLQLVREQRYPEAEPLQDMLYVTSPAVLARAVLSFDALAADLYWIRAIQYYGGRRLSRDVNRNYDLLYPLLDLTTSLDPRFQIAYRFGAFFLSERAPGGAGRPDLAVKLLQKGMEQDPRWEYLHDIGFVYYRERDFMNAAEWFRRGGEFPGGANWLTPLAAVTLATGGDVRSSRTLWRNILETSGQQWLEATARQRLQQLDAMEAIAALEQRIGVYAARSPEGPLTWERLVRDRVLRGIPLDPAGHPYVLNPWWPAVTVARDSPLWPLPDRPL